MARPKTKTWSLSFTIWLLVVYSHPTFIRLGECYDQCIELSCKSEEDNFTVIDNDTFTNNEQKCRLYVAESSIPNAGLGMYSGVNLDEGEEIHSEIVIQITDIQRQAKLRKAKTPNAQGLTDDHIDCRRWAEAEECEKNPVYMKKRCLKSCYDVEHGIPSVHISPSLLQSYYWSDSIGHATFLADYSESLLPGVGMLANSHTGLVNVRMTRPYYDNGGMDRRIDRGVGAFSSYHNYRFLADRKISQGQEIFAEYGDTWFENRENQFGLIPLSDDFIVGDKITHNFVSKIDDLALKNYSALIQDAWDLIRNSLLQKNDRLQMILPKSISEIEAYDSDSFSTAMYSIPNVIRDIEWLDQNGMCLDGLRVAQSTIPQAGRGAFATKKFQMGQIISPAPVIHLERRALQLYKEMDDGSIQYHGEQQLLLNYCYGHPQSSILLFPYAPAVNFINHSQNPNAFLKWSSMQGHHREYLTLTSREVLEKPHAGLIMEIIASQDIEEGAEIFLDYGSRWASTWNEYAASWKPNDVSDDFIPIELLNGNVLVKTEEEQEDEPYPENVMIYCYLLTAKKDFSSNNDDVKSDSHPWDLKGQSLDHLMRHLSNAKPCRILERLHDEGSDSMTYKIQAEVSTRNSMIITGVPRDAIEFLYRPYEADQFLSSSFRHDILIPDDIFPQSWRDLEVENRELNDDIVFETENKSTDDQCRFYLAESLIPNAGIGLFTAVDLNDGDVTQSDVAIHVHDYSNQKNLQCEFFGSGCDTNWLIASYEWHGHMTHSESDAHSVRVFVPGLGAMGNFHTALSNAYMVRPTKTGGGLHRMADPASGAISSYHDVHFQITGAIPKGREVFISYGENWFHGREGSIGKVPLKDSYDRADLILKKFDLFLQNETNFNFVQRQQLWSFIREELTFDHRVMKALPTNVEVIAEAAKVGAAIYSLPNRSIDWLLRKGVCLDNIRSAYSSIKNAGMGAFATKLLSSGEIITTTPLVHISRNQTILLKRTVEGGIIPYGHQLVRNYCYGHPRSSLLFLPYAPVVNYINTNTGSHVNAKMIWSSFHLHKSDWLQKSANEVIAEPYSGLFVDIVATKDIKMNEEIYLDYGANWQHAWDQHISRWKPSLNYISAFQLQKSERKIKTKFEQELDPYPTNVMIVCFVPSDIQDASTTRAGIHGDEYVWYESQSLLYFGDRGVPCSILSREVETESTYYLYTADVFFPNNHIRVGKIPRGFIHFVDKPYTGDEYLESAFRHEIGMPEDMFPQNWMDLHRE